MAVSFKEKPHFLSQKGVVLVITLVLLASISFMASFLYLKSAEKRKTLTLIQKRQIAEDFLPLFAQKLLALMKKYQEKYGAIPQEVTFIYQAGKTLGTGEVTIHLSDEGEKLNLNKASAEELFELFVKIGIPEEKALILRDSLLDWRDKDDIPRPQGAERDWYRYYTPRNGPIKDFSELLLIRGFDPYLLWFEPALFDKITIYAGTINHKEEQPEENSKFYFSEGGYYRLDLKVKVLPNGPIWQYTAVFRWQNTPQILFDLLR